MAESPTKFSSLTISGDVTVQGTLTGNGSEGFPTQTSNSGKFLTTNGSAPSWAALTEAAGNFSVVGALALSASGFSMAAIARTATAAGLTTGTIADGPTLQFIQVTCDDANKIIILPTPTPGSIVILNNGATGYELRSSAPASVAINGGSGSAAESAIPANSTVIAICITATAWKAIYLDADGDVAKVEAAAP